MKMGPSLCSPTTSWTEFGDDCIRKSWSIIPTALLVLYLIIPIRWSQYLPTVLVNSFSEYLTVHDAELLNKPNPLHDDSSSSVPPINKKPTSRISIICLLGLLQTLFWMGIGSYILIVAPSLGISKLWSSGLLPAYLTAGTWLYTTVYPALHPISTAPLALFTVYFLHLFGAVLGLGGVIYDAYVVGAENGAWLWAAKTVDLVVVVILLGVIMSMPMNMPTKGVNEKDIGKTITPEDYCSLFDWVTFHWIYPLIKRGRSSTLNDTDVWNLSLTMQSKIIFQKFSSTYRITLLRKLWACNSRDILLDFLLTFVSIIFNYTGPYFLRNILESIDSKNPTPASHSRAYIYAFLAFLCSIAKAQADVQHLWYGRRACTRVRSELMAAIYDKALKRKDFSGVVDKDRITTTSSSSGSSSNGGSGTPSGNGNGKARAKENGTKKEKDGGDEPKGGADVGKIVNLMAGDANRVAMLLGGIYFIYGAPLEIIIASVFLYQLLGLSAFAGFVVLILCWPLNSFVTKRSIRIQKGVLASRDKRMGVLNELIGAVKFIKFFAWEDKWIDRAMDSREVEMGWMIKARFNSVMFSMIWTLSPILVSIISFLVYVSRGNQLTVSVAFTSIALFSMIRTPLNVIPAWIVQLLQTKVALDRIATFLGEEEVTDQVSTLRREASGVPYSSSDQDEDEGFGLKNASFKWNEVDESKSAVDGTTSATSRKNGKASNAPGSPSSAEASTASVDDGESRTAASEESFSAAPSRFELRDIDVVFPEGELTVITGPTASGKTALLLAVLGELTLLSGRILMSKNPNKVLPGGLRQAISYAAQSPWLRHQSIKDNILFGSEWDEERYNEVVECCALRPDLDVLEDGDMTEIGARGVSLSGGQKARVALARAVYARTRYVLLDDPLSAVDSHTSRFLFDRLLCGPLLKGRTVILVTHHVELVLPGTYYIVRMLDGRLDTQGTVKDVRAQGGLDDIKHEATLEVLTQEQTKVIPGDAMGEVSTDEPTGDKPVAPAKKPRQLIKDEHRETGGIKWSVYKTYLRASSYYVWTFLAVLVVLSQCMSVFEKYWIKKWGEGYGQNATSAMTYQAPLITSSQHELILDAPMNAIHHYHHLSLSPVQTQEKGDLGIDWPDANQHPLFYVGVYAAIGFCTAAFTLLSYIAQYVGAIKASRTLFQQLLVKVVRATMRWHDITPQGRMLNRFGKDIETIDSSLAGSLQNVNTSLATFFAAILTITFIFPWFLVPAILIGLAYRELAIGYLNTGRDLRRMESNTRSPIFSDFGEVLEGIVTVRAFSAEKRFLSGLHEKIDTTTKMWYAFWMTNRWLLLNYDALGALSVLVTTLFALSGYVKAGTAGLCITSAMSFTMSIYWACRFWTALELDLNSVERVVEYLDLPQEPAAIIESHRPPAYWPSSTTNAPLISVESLTIKYAPELPSVLHDVSFSLNPRERIGLLGRTGSGKSTLAMSILRFVDPTSGRILIDGIDISTIGLYDLRSRITFIPQDATLFSGTLRQNLDPFDEHDDQACLDVLYRVQLVSESAHASTYNSRDTSRASSIHDVNINREDTQASTTPAGSIISTSPTDTDPEVTISLDSPVSAGGSNFSQGQRQLIAMARALLRRSSIIVLDEATSSIDFKTDAKIQATIREEFNESLLLTVAHRLRTVIDYDRLVVLDKGRVVEFDTPYNLIQKENGVFRNMCLKSGTFGELEAAAKEKAQGFMQ